MISKKKHPKRDWKLYNQFPLLPNSSIGSIPKGIESKAKWCVQIRAEIKKHPKRDWKIMISLWHSDFRKGKHPKRDWKVIKIYNHGFLKNSSRSIPKGIERLNAIRKTHSGNVLKHPKRDWKRRRSRILLNLRVSEASQKGLKARPTAEVIRCTKA